MTILVLYSYQIKLTLTEERLENQFTSHTKTIIFLHTPNNCIYIAPFSFILLQIPI